MILKLYSMSTVDFTKVHTVYITNKEASKNVRPVSAFWVFFFKVDTA